MAPWCCLQNHLLEMDAKRAPGPTWETVRYMVSAIQYGGRITDEFDKLLMNTYAEKYFTQARAVPSFLDSPCMCWMLGMPHCSGTGPSAALAADRGPERPALVGQFLQEILLEEFKGERP